MGLRRREDTRRRGRTRGKTYKNEPEEEGAAEDEEQRREIKKAKNVMNEWRRGLNVIPLPSFVGGGHSQFALLFLHLLLSMPISTFGPFPMPNN
jgi:hypothetical protein